MFDRPNNLYLLSTCFNMCNFVMCWSQEQVYKIGPTNFSNRKELLTAGVKKNQNV